MTPPSRPDFAAIVAGAGEDREVFSEGGAERELPEGGAAAGGATPALDKFTVDLTADAASGRIDPVLGRDSEIRQIIDILTRRRQNNPILTGEAGVGKTAVVEGLRPAHRRPATCRRRCSNVDLRTLDLGLLQAGAGVKGEFENRLKQVIEEVQVLARADHPVHRRGAHPDRRRRRRRARTTPPTCSSPPSPAASCAPSPPPPGPSTRSTSRRTRPWPAASRWSRSRSPTSERRIVMMRGLAATLEKHHGVRILDEAVQRVGAPLAPLHPGPPAARQVGERARHRLRPGGDRPERRARPRSRTCAGAWTTSPPSCASSSARLRLGRRPRRAARRAAAKREAAKRRAGRAEARWSREAGPGRRDLDLRGQPGNPGRDGTDGVRAGGQAGSARSTQATANGSQAASATPIRSPAIAGSKRPELAAAAGRDAPGAGTRWTGRPSPR